MTGRRAVRQWDERLSRALQFVPGHVGGRVASAQPIRRRGGTLRRVSVGAGGAAPVLPTSYDYNYDAGSGDATTDVGGWLTSGAMLGVVLVSEGASTPPAGWTTLDSGSSGGLNWIAAGLDAYAAQSTTWTLPGSGEWAWFAFEFVGSSGLALAVSAAEHTGTASGTWIAPDAGMVMFTKLNANLNCEYNHSTYGGVSGNYWRGNGWTDLWLWWPSNNYFAGGDETMLLPGAVNQYDEVWTPTGAYTNTTAGYSGTPEDISIVLGLVSA